MWILSLSIFADRSGPPQFTHNRPISQIDYMMVFCVGVSGLRSVSPHVAITAAVSSVGVQPQQLQDGCVVYTKTPPQMDAEHVAHMHASRNEERGDSHTHTHTHTKKRNFRQYIYKQSMQRATRLLF